MMIIVPEFVCFTALDTKGLSREESSRSRLNQMTRVLVVSHSQDELDGYTIKSLSGPSFNEGSVSRC